MKNKENTKRKLIDAVGEIIRQHGFKFIRISKVAQLAGVDRKLIYRYFGNLDNLIEAYITENDYWMIFADHLKTLLKDQDVSDNKALVIQILQEQFKFFYAEKKMQGLILMELSEKNTLMHSIHNARESLGQQFFEKTDAHFKNSDVNFRAVAALLVGGIYYMILHTRNNGYNFSGINLNTQEGINSVLETVARIVEWAYLDANN